MTDLASKYCCYASIPKARRNEIDTLLVELVVKKNLVKIDLAKRSMKRQREKCWKNAFDEHWNTDKPFTKPTLERRKLEQSGNKVGVLNRDLTDQPTKHQRCGVPVYLHPHINWEDTLGLQHINGAPAVVKNEPLQMRTVLCSNTNSSPKTSRASADQEMSGGATTDH
ncbi:hypothetical protein OQA88_3707 [Cercophora sp. LCS_1]